MIRDLGESVGDAVLTRAGRAAAAVQERRSLPVDLLERDDAYLAIVDAPGAVASDVQVRYTDGTVLVRIDRFREFHEGFQMRFPGRGLALGGEVELPEDAVVSAEHASATLTERGTLDVELPKVETAEIGVTGSGDGDADGGAGEDESDVGGRGDRVSEAAGDGTDDATSGDVPVDSSE